MEIKKELKKEYQEYVDKNNDPYGRAVILSGESFMNFIDEGKSFDEAEKLMLQTPHGDGLTGYMMGALMSAVVHFHLKGEEIKIWWNKRVGGTGEEKGTINPAILTIET